MYNVLDLRHFTSVRSGGPMSFAKNENLQLPSAWISCQTNAICMTYHIYRKLNLKTGSEDISRQSDPTTRNMSLYAEL